MTILLAAAGVARTKTDSNLVKSPDALVVGMTRRTAATPLLVVGAVNETTSLNRKLCAVEAPLTYTLRLSALELLHGEPLWRCSALKRSENVTRRFDTPVMLAVTTWALKCVSNGT